MPRRARAETATPRTAIAVFARAPIAGEAKTRLIPRLGAERAAALQGALIRKSLHTALAADLGPVSLWCAPDCGHPTFIECAKTNGVQLFPQQGADLGMRMANAFSSLCRRGSAMLIGTDCPALTALDLRAAADALTENDAAIIPAEDGGYVLVALRRPVAALFAEMPWGSSRIMAETRLRLRRAGLRWLELPVSWDVDRPEDLDRLEASGLLDHHDALAR